MNYPLFVAIILLAGLTGGKLAHRLKLPSVTGFVIFGLLIGPSVFNIITKTMIKDLSFVNELAVAVLAISIGGELHWKSLKKYAKDLSLVALGDLGFTFLLITGGSLIFGLDPKLAIVLGVLGMTVSPSGVVHVIKDYKARGELTMSLLTMVAIDNLVCIVIFAIATDVVLGMYLGTASFIGISLGVIKDLSISIGIGIGSGLFIVNLVRRRTNDNKFLVFVVALMLLNTGLANMLKLSPLLINIITGATVVNLTNRNRFLSNAIERIELPISVLFLTLAGAKLDLSIAFSSGLIGLIYILGRFSGKYFGTRIMSRFTGLPDRVRKNIGLGLMPQAGVVIGLSILAEQKLPFSNGILTGVALTGVIFFEVFGPMMTGKALKDSGEADVKS